MPSLGELFVSLGFDVDDQKLKDFNEGIKNGLEGVLKLSAAATAGVGALSAFVMHAADSAITLKNMTVDLGASTQAAQTFANVLHQVRPNISVPEGISKWTDYYKFITQDMLKGNGGAGASALSMLGVNWHEGDSPEKIFDDLRKHWAEKVAIMGPSLATSYLDQIPGLRGASQVMGVSDRQLQEAAFYNTSQQAIDSTSRLAQSMGRLDEGMHKFTEELSGELSKPLKYAIDEIVHAVDSIIKFNANNPGAGTVETGLGALLGFFLGKKGFGYAKSFFTGAEVAGGGAAVAGAGEASINAMLGMGAAGMPLAAGMGLMSLMASAPWAGSWAGTKIGEYFKGGGGSPGGGGFNRTHVQGIIDRLYMESGMRPNAYHMEREGGGSNKMVEAYGLAQLHPYWQGKFKEWSGHDIHGTSAEEQMSFLNYELTKGLAKNVGDKIMQQNTEKGAYLAYTRGFENPAAVNVVFNLHSIAPAHEIARHMEEKLKSVWGPTFAQSNLQGF